MTSGRFASLPISSIIINRDERQRRELPQIPELAESIHRVGLIHPIVIDQDHVLVAGERRLTAVKSLGWTAIPVQFAEDLSEYELQCIEFEENVKRVDLTWQEETAALERFHLLKQNNEEGWSAEQTADSLGMSVSKVNRSLQVAKELTNEKVASSPKFSAALNVVQRNLERRKAAITETVKDQIETVLPSAEEETETLTTPILNANFHEWQEAYDGPKFNLIHCDFPYGINVADSPRQNAALTDHYEDSPDIYWALLGRLEAAMKNVVADSAHLIFWFSMDYYADTVQWLTKMGWTVNPFPLIWHKSDNAGIAPDPQRFPRRTYEAALFAYRGHGKLTEAGPKANSFAHPGKRTDAIHISEKPEPMLRHFLSMVCDEYTSFLDPTCGSGNSVKVARDLGAERVQGIELNPEFHALACANWEKTSGSQSLSDI